MITITINEETHTIEDMITCLQTCGERLREGFTSSNYPSFTIQGEEEEHKELEEIKLPF